MNRDFFNRAIYLPLCLALILGIALFIYMKFNVDNFIPLYNNTQYAYHDESIDEESKGKKDAEGVAEYEEDKNASLDSFEKNQCIGVIRAGNGYPIRYDMDYTRVMTSVSFVKGSVAFGDTGFVYIYSGNKNAKEIAKEKTLSIGSVFGDKTYRFKESKNFKSEYKVLNFAPDCGSAVILYYRDSETAGFTSNYVALVYEEVK